MYDGVQEIPTCHKIGVLFLPENTRKCEFENILIYEWRVLRFRTVVLVENRSQTVAHSFIQP